MVFRARERFSVACALALFTICGSAPARGDVTAKQVEDAIRSGVRYLVRQQQADGSWPDADVRAHTGTTSLVMLSLLTAGERIGAPHIDNGLAFLERMSTNDLGRTYSVALQTMVFAAADPAKYRIRLAKNVEWLERAQIKEGDFHEWPGSWTYTADKETPGDNSNTQYALLGLHAAAEVGIPVKPEVWLRSRQYWEMAQRRDGGWGYMPYAGDTPTASMTCAGISSLVITGLKRFQGQEVLLPNGEVRNCGRGGLNVDLQAAVEWLSRHFRVNENWGRGQLWKYYYLYGLERAGRLTGQRFFGQHDWYREGAEYLVHEQDRLQGYWVGSEHTEREPIVSSSFALLFLAKGRAPVLINKSRHGPGVDWDNDHDDVRNLVGAVSRDWKELLTWQVVDPGSAAVEDLLMAPILFLNGHEAPEFSGQAKRALREYVEQGGLIFAEACCGRPEFDQGFRALMTELFPEPEYELKPLPEDHAVWRSKHLLTPEIHPLWGIEYGCRTVVIYTPKDLSCGWNQAEAQPDHLEVIKALKVGQNVVDYATGRELPADKLTPRDTTKFRLETAKRGALHIAKLKHAGEWNIAPLSIPNLSTLLRDQLKMDVVINHRELFANDPNLSLYPLIYAHGRAGLSFPPDHMQILRRHLEPGGGVIFADAACGSTAFDTSFRKFVAELLPEHPLEPIPPEDELYHLPGGFDLSSSKYTQAAGGGTGPPQLEGVKIDGHWAVIYSRYDIGCALERHQGIDCKGYTHESALKIAANIVLYATLP
jgi:prenyltransferase beta subunit